jgi:hypothetical protein
MCGALAERRLERSDAELVDTQKRISVSQKIKSSAKAIEVNSSSGPRFEISSWKEL